MHLAHEIVRIDREEPSCLVVHVLWGAMRRQADFSSFSSSLPQGKRQGSKNGTQDIVPFYMVLVHSNVQYAHMKSYF